MKEELEYSLKRFKDAFVKLKEGSVRAKLELEIDGVIQRFEFTFELLWKTLRIFLKEQGVDVKTPKDCLKEAFRLGWLKEEQIFIQMLEDRNETSHVYEEKKAREIFARIKSQYVALIGSVVEDLVQRLKKIKY